MLCRTLILCLLFTFSLKADQNDYRLDGLFDLLLKAVHKMFDKTVVIKVVGGGYEIDKHKELAGRLGMLSRVLFTGFCKNRQELAKHYNKASCLAVTSDSGESFSLTAIEAMSCGCPVIASNIPGVRGRVENEKTGWLFESGNVDDLTKKLEKVLSLNEIERMLLSERARKIAVEKYDWQIHNEKLINVYKLTIN